MSKNYYDVLGVSKTATQDEIKKAFRKKAHEYHPDKKTGDEAKFKEINEAYQVLGNEQKRSQYDQFGSQAFSGGAGQGGFGGFDGFSQGGFSQGGVQFDMDDLGDIFGDFFGFGGGRRGRSQSSTQRGADLQTVIEIDFMEAVFGVEKEISLRKKVKCDRCQGNGAEPGTKIETCPTCKGSGKVSRVQRSFLGNIQMQTACPDCGGEGKKISKKCSKCSGQGVFNDSVKIKVKIPAGINHGETIRLSGHGGAGVNGGQNGDLYLQISIKESSKFTREGYDVRSKIELSFKQVAMGDKIEVDTVDGPVKLKIPAGTQPGTIFKLRDHGVPRLQGRGRGDHLVTVKVVVPKSLNRKQKKALEESF